MSVNDPEVKEEQNITRDRDVSGSPADDAGLGRVHAINLRLLKEIDRICRKYGIQYMLDSGTLLGAIRHEGFIPWDDDCDVVFTRTEFEKFREVVRDELPEGISFVEPDEYHEGKAFYDFIYRLTYDNSRKFWDTDKQEWYGGKISRLNVDIFVVDALPDGKIAKRITKLAHCIVYGLALGHRYKLDYSDYSGMMKIFVAVLSHVGKLIPFGTIVSIWQKLCLKDDKKETKYYFYTNYAPDYYYVEIKRVWYDYVIEVPFEDTKFFIPIGWKQYLTQTYGNFMELPPREKQVPAHSDMEIVIDE